MNSTNVSSSTGTVRKFKVGDLVIHRNHHFPGVAKVLDEVLRPWDYTVWVFRDNQTFPADENELDFAEVTIVDRILTKYRAL